MNVKKMDLNQLNNLKDNLSDRLIRVTTEMKRIENKIDGLDTNFNIFNNKAKTALNHNREKLAERILKKKQRKMNKISVLENHLSTLREVKIELINTKKQVEELIEKASPNTSVAVETELSVPEMPKIPTSI